MRNQRKTILINAGLLREDVRKRANERGQSLKDCFRSNGVSENSISSMMGAYRVKHQKDASFIPGAGETTPLSLRRVCAAFDLKDSDYYLYEESIKRQKEEAPEEEKPQAPGITELNEKLDTVISLLKEIRERQPVRPKAYFNIPEAERGKGI